MRTKRFIVSFALSLLILKLNAQSFSLQTIAGNPLNYGDTVIVSGTTNDFQLTSSLVVINNSNSQKSVMVERTLLNLFPGCDNAFAWGFMMYPPSVNSSVDPSIINAGVVDSTFYTWYFCNGIAGVSYIKFRFYDDNNPADSAWMVFQFNVVQVAGLTAISDENNLSVFPNPATGIFNVSLPKKFLNLSAEIYNAKGIRILSKSISSKFSIDLSNQPSGIYLLRLRDKGSDCIETIKLLKK